MSNSSQPINKDLILRENLALQRTILANQTTLLAFLRTSMYFLVAGLSIKNLLNVPGHIYYQVIFYLIAIAVLIFGAINYFRHKKKITQSEIHIGNYKLDYENK